MADTLEDVLNEAPKEESKEVVQNVSSRQVWTDKEQEARGNVRDPVTGQYSPKEPKEAPKEVVKEEVKAEVNPVKEAVKDEYSPRERAAFAKAADETRKRQALERQIEDFKKKESEKPFFDDPDGALARQRQDLESKLNFSVLSTKVQTSESIARSRHTDYDEKFAVFNEMVQEAPHLAQQAFQASDPAEFAYRTAKLHKDLQDAGGVDKMRERMEAELRGKVRAEIEAEFKKRQSEHKEQVDSLPGSITDVQSKGVNRPVWGGPPDLDDILKG